jgi:hypothetical protein
MRVLSQYLVIAALLALLAGVPTVLVWLRSKRTLSLRDSYHRALLHVARLFGLVFMAIAILGLIFALAALAGVSHFGYPIFSAPLFALFFAVGYGIQRIAAQWLRRA